MRGSLGAGSAPTSNGGAAATPGQEVLSVKRLWAEGSKAKPSASPRHGTVRHGTAGRDRMGLLREELRAPRCSVRAEANRVEPSLIEPS
ncbi:hypothetical protein LUU34_00521000 [Aix galericulata]|nr:hypothetical protein LUU34_00521000 [Aix galericulata]